MVVSWSSFKFTFVSSSGMITYCEGFSGYQVIEMNGSKLDERNQRACVKCQGANQQFTSCLYVLQLPHHRYKSPHPHYNILPIIYHIPSHPHYSQEIYYIEHHIIPTAAISILPHIINSYTRWTYVYIPSSEHFLNFSGAVFKWFNQCVTKPDSE